jgi:KDO2-lipid IV(A) lauroyltransferase
MLSRLGVLLMRALAPLPLPVVRGLGWLLGWFLYLVVAPRRHVVRRNLEVCFPGWTDAQRQRLVPKVFIAFAQAWIDRSWLWHAPPDVLRRRLAYEGALDELAGTAPTILFLPHFVGLDAAWMAVALHVDRSFTTIYTQQANPVVDEWILQGRQRFGKMRLLRRSDGVKAIVSSLREGVPLFLLPDMNFGAEESVFVPFYGVQAATVPSLSRFARLGRAKVVPVLSRLTPTGYTVQVLPAWPDFPTDDAVADTAVMNARLQDYIDGMPHQYFWVHKRFKTRPEGADPVY